MESKKKEKYENKEKNNKKGKKKKDSQSKIEREWKRKRSEENRVIPDQWKKENRNSSSQINFRQSKWLPAKENPFFGGSSFQIAT